MLQHLLQLTAIHCDMLQRTATLSLQLTAIEHEEKDSSSQQRWKQGALGNEDTKRHWQRLRKKSKACVFTCKGVHSRACVFLSLFLRWICRCIFFFGLESTSLRANYIRNAHRWIWCLVCIMPLASPPLEPHLIFLFLFIKSTQLAPLAHQERTQMEVQ